MSAGDSVSTSAQTNLEKNSSYFVCDAFPAAFLFISARLPAVRFLDPRNQSQRF